MSDHDFYARPRVAPAAPGAGGSTRQRAQRAGSPRAAERYEKGAVGEQLVAEALEPLAVQGWVLLHDRRKPGSPANLDHVLVGPAGVLVVDAKNWTGGRVRLDARGIAVGSWRRDDALHAARIDADVVRDAIRRTAPHVPVVGVLALVHDMGLDGPVLHQGAYVVQRSYLLAWAASLPAVMTGDEAYDLAKAVARAFPAKLGSLAPRATPGRPTGPSRGRPVVSVGDKVRLGVVATFLVAVVAGGGPALSSAFGWVGAQFAHAVVPSIAPRPTPGRAGP